MAYVYSTASTDTLYKKYLPADPKSNTPVPFEKKILIKGQANIADRKNIITPRGVVTEVDDADLEWLMADRCFEAAFNAGLYSIEKKEVKNIDDVIKNMEPKDKSAPLTPEDCKAATIEGDGVHSVGA